MGRSLLFLILFCLASCAEKKEQVPDENITIEQSATTLDKQAEERPVTFADTVQMVLDAFENKDQNLIDVLTLPQQDVIVLFRMGVFNEYKQIEKIDFSSPVPSSFPYPSVSSNFKLQYGELPKFDCGTMEWDKHGLYCDTIRKDTLLSGAPMNLRKYRGDKIPESEINKIKKLEEKSRRVVLADKNNSLIFYLILIGDKWYITALDRITTDCSA